MSENESRFSSAGLDLAGDTSQSSGHSGPGQLLQSQRIALGLTIEQAASQLNLAPRQVAALETDDYDKLPGMASVRGFVRSYAKLLKLDAEPLVGMIAHMGASPLVEPLTQRRALSAPFFDDSRMPAMGVQGPQNKTNLMLPGVIALVVLLFAGFQFGVIPSPNLAQKPASAEAVAEPQSAASVELPKAEPVAAPLTASVPAVEAASASASASASAVASVPAPAPAAVKVEAAKVEAAKSEPAKVESAKVESAKVEPPKVVAKTEPAKTETPKAEPVKPEVKVAAKPEPAKTDAKPAEAPKADAAKVAAAKPTEVKPADAKPAEVVAPANRGALVIKFVEDTWIDIRKVNAVGPDSVVASRIAKAGTTESFDVPGEISVTVGNVAGVESASLRGSAVDYKTPAKNNVSRLNLK